jgi:very-short-patch-repair endonuclease
MAAVLSCGSRAALSHRSAAALWGFARAIAEPIEVSVPFASPRHRPGVRVYRRPHLRPRDVDVHDGIPVVVPVLTLIDLARTVGDAGLERAINEADRIDLIDPETLALSLEDYPSRPGIARMRSILGHRTFRLTDSELERRFLPLVVDAGLPTPWTQRLVNGFKVDFFWPDLRLVVETDGLRYHRTPAQQARDRVRDQAHLAAGFVPLRFTHWQVRYEASYVRSVLVAVARRLGGAKAA